MRVSLVVPAGGNGSRFGAGPAKQLRLLRGRAVLLRSIDAFVGLVDEVVIPVADDLRAQVEALLAAAALPLPARLAAGGATRQQSVHNGLLASSSASAVVLVHDAVRPLVPRRCIEECLRALATHPAALVAIPCTSTVKRAQSAAGRADLVDATVPREDLWLAQTPQGFRRDLGLAAFARANAERWECSDDAQVLERAGHTVALVPGDARNLKLTTPDDWAIAEALVGADSEPS